jgi:AcrR family transcriptional regulator
MEENKNRIVTEASRLFLRHGAKSITMDDVAKECGMSKRTLYEYFPDKESLLGACIEKFIETKHAEREELLNSSDNIIDAIAKSVMRHMVQDISPLFFIEVKRFYPSVAKKYLDKSEETRCTEAMEFLKLGVKQGLFRKSLNLNILCDYMLKTENTMQNITTDVIHEKKFDLKEYFLTFFFLFFRGLSTDKGIALIEKYEKELL